MDENDAKSWRDCYFNNASYFLEELLERVSGDYDPYNYVEDEVLPISFDDQDLEDFDWYEEE